MVLWMSQGRVGRRGCLSRLRCGLLAALLVAVALPVLGTVAARSLEAPEAAIDLHGSWIVGFASTGDRMVVASSTEVMLVVEPGLVLLRRSMPGILRSMALSPDGSRIYVSRSSPPGVDQLDSTTLATLASATFTDGSCPGDMAVAGGRIWLDLACTAQPLASMDAGLTTPLQHVASVADVGAMAASPDGARIFVHQRWSALEPDRGGRLSVIDASDPAATELAAVSFPDGVSARGLAASRYGGSLVVGGRPVRVLDARTLEIRTSLTTFDRVDEVAITRDGRHVVGTSLRRDAEREDDVLWWSIDHPGQIGSARPTEPDLTPRLAASPDGGGAYSLGDDGHLHRLPIGPDPARLEVAVDPGPGPGLVRVHGALAMTDGAASAGQAVVVSRATPFGSPVPLAAVTAPDGSFSVTDLVPLGAFTYRARWAGDASHRAALAMVSGGTTAAVALAAPSGRPDRAVPVPDGSRLLAVDDVHGRILLDEGGPPGSVAVTDLEGAPTGTLLLPAPPLEIIASSPGTDLFAVLAGGAGIAVVDGATLTLVHVLAAGPVVPSPSRATLIGGRLWVGGVGRSAGSPGPRLLQVVDLANPVDAVAEPLGYGPYGDQPFADASDPAAFFHSDAWGLHRVSLTDVPPATVASTTPSNLAPGGTLASAADGTLYDAAGYRLRDLDGVTLTERRSRPADLIANAVVVGPSRGLVATAHGSVTGIEPGGVEIWSDAEAPIHRYRYPDRMVYGIGTTRDGARIVALSRHAGSAVVPIPPYGTSPPTLLHVLQDPFGACRIIPDGLPLPLPGGVAATLTGVLTTAGGTPEPGAVTISIGSVSATVQAGSDGRFSAALVPTGLGAATISYALAGDALHGCAASSSVTLGAPPSGPPAAPDAVTASPSRGAAVVRWSPPAADGGAPVTGYEVVATASGRTVSATAAPDQREVVLATLLDDVPVQVTVRAGNRHGWGPTRASSPVTPSRWWPFSTAAALVDRQYRDILERPPTPAEASPWVASLTNGTASATDLAVTLYYSVEAQNGPLTVTQLWITGTHEYPDRATLSTWVARLRGGASLSTFGRAVAQQPGFAARYGGLGNRAFVDALAKDLFGAPLAAVTASQWAAALAPDKLQRGDLFAFFSLQPRARSRWIPWVGTDLVLLDQLGAAPAQDVLFADITRIANGSLTLPGLVDSLTRAPAYGARWGVA